MNGKVSTISVSEFNFVALSCVAVLAQFLTTWINLSYEILGSNFLSYLTSQNIPSGPEIHVSCPIHSSLS